MTRLTEEETRGAILQYGASKKVLRTLRDADIKSDFKKMTDKGVPNGTAIQRLITAHGVSRATVYRALNS